MYSFVKGVLSRWWLILLVALVTVVVGTLPRPVEYLADAKIMFKVGREYLYQPETGARTSPIASTSGVKNAINGESQILNSVDIKTAALENYGLEKYLSGLESRRHEGLLSLSFLQLPGSDVGEGGIVSDRQRLEVAIEALTNAMRVKTIENTSILHLSITDSTPESAEAILEELISVFMQARQKIYDDTNSDLMGDKLSTVSGELETAEKALLEFNTANDIYSLEDQQKLLVQQSLTISQQRDQAEASVAELTTRIGLVNERLDKTPQTISIYTDQQANKLVEEAKARLFELELEQNKLLVAFREDSQTVSSNRREIETVQAFIANQEEATTETVRTGRNDVFDKLTIDKINIESELVAARTRLLSMDDSLRRVNEKLLSIDSLRTAQRKFERNIETLETRRRGYQEKAEDASLIDELSREERTNARIIQDPAAALRPIGLNLTQRTVLSIILGLLGGVIFAALVELFSRGGLFHSRSGHHARLNEQILDAPVLATIGSK